MDMIERLALQTPGHIDSLRVVFGIKIILSKHCLFLFFVT